jgi:hypothetical protein
MVDNGAFTFWTHGAETDSSWWEDFYLWAERWLAYPTTWAVIPDVIDGDEAENDRLLAAWPFGERGAPVWHMHESLERLVGLVTAWPKVCIGSSGAFARLGSRHWHRRMEQVFNAVWQEGPSAPYLHLLRGLAQVKSGIYPFASVDSTGIAQNHARELRERGRTALELADEWDRLQCPAAWRGREQLALAAAGGHG